MSRKDYIVIANAMIGQINNGFVKKKDIDVFIGAMRNRLAMNYSNFMADTFINYIKRGIKC